MLSTKMSTVILSILSTYNQVAYHWTGVTEEPPKYIIYRWQHRSVQGCGRSNLWRVILFSFFF